MAKPLNGTLQDIPVDLIRRNEQNPRLIFRPGEMEQLLDSIRRYGIQVPISVYKEGDHFVLIDGERRFRCSRKLNRKTVPGIIQPRPSPLDNLLMMFNIHSLREQWDLLTIALKLPDVITLLTEELGAEPNEKQLAERTGLNRGTIRRCRLLMELPEHYKQRILEELRKPKRLQRVTEDTFIELERALRTVVNAMPETVDDLERVRVILLGKYERGIIDNKVDFRKIARIARATRVGANRQRASRELTRLFADRDYRIETAYGRSVEDAYAERDIKTTVRSLLERIETLKPSEIDEELGQLLGQLRRKIEDLLEQIA
jgi:ParB family transcriptional regulator, chromosome partitioning protein